MNDDRLGEAISQVAFILDCLMSYRNIIQSGDCNTCHQRGCEYIPNPGEQVRFNCPFYKESEEV